jgi:hypothetical protein
MVAQRQGLDFASIMNGGKIFLAKLSHGLIGEENSYLLGALLVTKFQQLAMGRQETAAVDRRPFTLCIDEFHNFATPSMAAVLSGARKYRLGLVLAHQELGQLADQDSRVASAVLTNPGTRICFRVGDADAKKLAEGFSSFESSGLQSLGVGEAICRVDRAEHDFTLRTARDPIVEGAKAHDRQAEIVRRSRLQYAQPRAAIEALLAVGRRESEEEPRLNLAPESATLKGSTIKSVERAPALQPTPEAPPSRIAKQTRAANLGPLPLGRGGREHKYLQSLVKRLAEDRGWRAVVEQPVLAGAGSVDVSLERGDRRIAVEIAVTTEVEHEINNIQKCFAGGFHLVVCLSSEPKTLRRVQERATTTLEASTRERIRFLGPEELVLFLDELAANDASAESVVRGYRVKRGYQALSNAEAESRKLAIARVLGGRTKVRG